MSWSIGLPAESSSSNSRARRRGGGFTLLEVIVAFTILAVALVALMQAFSSGLRGLDAAQVHAGALLHARSKLEEIAAVATLVEGEDAGTFADGFAWTAAVRRHELEAEALGSLVPYEIEVTVTGPGAGAVTLTTLRLAVD